MRTVKQVAALTGVSVRTLQYYDEIGVLKPTEVTGAGYRLYDDEALKTLQQILFFKELDFPLKEIRKIMEDPGFDRNRAFKKQRELLQVKRNRLDRLLALLDSLEKGQACPDFEAFDLSEYLQALEDFKTGNSALVIEHWGSLEAFEQLMKKVKADEAHAAGLAVRQYGSVEKYTAAMKDSLRHFSENMEKIEAMKQDGTVEKNAALMEALYSSREKDPASPGVQAIVGQLITLGESVNLNIDRGEHYWDMMIDGYLHNDALIKAIDGQKGDGTSAFVGRAFQCYFGKE
ncbi:MerR family transcriptional regulator [Eubacterium sp. 1001713B170207_170306_E7]|uniref:MerR family transcriptional regulator n=1 Tax=Eubacterium sp. 1001713B170207_170306_E7 TaxID=2787097 RepID=UPI0018981855|nr:MerR family transcriptional regulator [Eubacterium sp. 1001713B170207_170306_E7]